jgi:hypothetical protein
MIAAASIHPAKTPSDEPVQLATDQARTAAALHVIFPAGIYRPIYRTPCGTIYRAERPVRVNGIPWEHAGLLITNDGTHAFQFNENQAFIEVLNQSLSLGRGS